jgi:hypothetical protein
LRARQGARKSSPPKTTTARPDISGRADGQDAGRLGYGDRSNYQHRGDDRGGAERNHFDDTHDEGLPVTSEKYPNCASYLLIKEAEVAALHNK